MNFHNPIAFAWAALLPLVVLLYFLKLKRKEVPVSSTYLWKKSIQDMRVNSLFQRLRRNLLLFLQLLALAAAVLALTQPYLDVRGFERKSRIVLIDRSASMNAVEEGISRLDLAKEAARTIVEDLSRGDEAAVIAFSTGARVLSAFTSSKVVLRRAIDSIEPGEGRTDITGALEIAANLARLRRNPEVVLLSDGRFARGGEARLEGATFRYVPIGAASPNIGITSLDLRRGLDRYGDVEAFVRVESFSDSAQVVTVVLLVEGKEFDAARFELPAGEARSRVFTGLGRLQGRLEVRLETEAEDVLAADDAAHAILEPPERMRVGLVTAGNYFLERLLRLDPDLIVEVAGPGAIGEGRGLEVFEGFDPDVVILDRVAPPDLPPGSYLTFGEPPPIEGFAREGTVEGPVVLDWDRSHPATRFVNLDTLRLGEAVRLSVPRGTELLVEGDSGPLVVAYETEGVRIVHVSFDIYDSNWPLRLSFPIFVSNTLRFLGSDPEGRSPRRIRTGEVIGVRTEGEVDEVVVTGPGGVRETIDATGETEVYFAGTDRAGVYRVEVGDRTEEYAVNLLDPAESDLVPAEEPDVGGEVVTAPEASLQTNRDIWRPLVLLAFVVLILEWAVYHRRV